MPTRKSYAVGGGINSLPSWREIETTFSGIIIAPQNLAGADGLLWTPPTVTGTLYAVWFRLVNGAGVVQTITLGQDVGAVGGLGVGEYWLSAEPVNHGVWPWDGPFHVPGEDTVRGLNVGGAGNVITITMRAVQLW